MNPTFTSEPPALTPPASAAAPAIPDIGTPTPEDATQERLRGEALLAVPFRWKDRELAPFAIGRESFWHQHRAALNCPDHGSLIISRLAFQPDVARILWLCAHEPRTWLHQLADAPRYEKLPPSKPGGEPIYRPLNAHVLLEEEITRWWEGQMAEATDDDFLAAYGLVLDILKRRHATRAHPRRTVEESEEDGAGN